MALAASTPALPQGGREQRRRLNVLTWHVHGNYLWYLSQAPHDFHLLTLPDAPSGYAGRAGTLPWGSNVHEAPAESLHLQRFDCVLYQSRVHWEGDRHERLSDAQRALPAIFLEHDPPQQHPTATRHPAADGGAHIVHVTHFNALMWDTGDAPVSVIEHGVMVPGEVIYTGERPEGIVVVNHLQRRGRRLGADLYERIGREVPLALAGMESKALGGIGEVPNLMLAATMARYRFYFHPVRYTSLGLALIEAMMLGMPVVALATTELPSLIKSGDNGYIDTRTDRLVEAMRALIDDPALARRWGDAGRESVRQRFAIARFAAEWDRLLLDVAGG